jgi:hypothetical protein
MTGHTGQFLFLNILHMHGWKAARKGFMNMTSKLHGTKHGVFIIKQFYVGEECNKIIPF